jgi:8-hydroxy-5-deazaflavin:NADPH oxidoreductase
MNIGIIGSGAVGQQLAKDLISHGHKVTIGTRDASKLSEFSSLNPNVRLASNADAAKFGEMVLLATHWDGTQNAIVLADPKNLTGKVVVDITNPLDFSSGQPALSIGFNTSAGEQVQAWLPESHVVKALNSITAHAMLNPKTYIGGNPDMFIAGNDQNAKKTVQDFLEAVGWGVVDLGDITKSRLIEPLAMIWITVGFNSGWTKSNHAFQLLNK